MKLHLLLSTAVTMLSAVSAKNAGPQLRGLSAESKDASAVIFEGSDPFQDGYDDGKDAAYDLWDDLGDDCANAFDFEDEAKKEEKKKGWNKEGRNYKEKAYNDGARKGMKEVVDEKEKECLHDDPEECIGLGEAASSTISYNYCNMFGSTSYTNYKKECRDVAVSQCKGGIYDKVKRNCGAPDTSTLKELQGKCSDTVDDLLGIPKSSKESSGSSSDRKDSCIDDKKPKKDGFEFKYVDEGKCVDEDNNTYEYGQFDDVKDFSKCAKKCVGGDVDDELVDELKGFDWNCDNQKCRCLFDEGTLSKSDEDTFDSVDRDKDGEGKVEGTKDADDWFCAKLEKKSSRDNSSSYTSADSHCNQIEDKKKRQQCKSNKPLVDFNEEFARTEFD